MPARVLEYLNRLADKGLFVTKLFGMARIYTNGSWEANLDKLSSDQGLQAAVALDADRFGADAELDPQGRLTLPQTLRKALGVEDQTVYLRFHYDVVLVYRIDGPFFFGAAEKLERMLERAPMGIVTVVLRFGRVPFVDATGMQTLLGVITRFRRRHVRVLLCGIHPGLQQTLRGGGVLDLVGMDNL